MTVAETNRKYASARMQARNPMRDAAVRAAVSAKLREMGHSPSVRGGNGREATDAEKMLLVLFEAQGFILQLAVPTKQNRQSGYPSCYKVDLGHSELMLAIEADGPSHTSLARRAQDAKKDAFLAGLGWTVLRFTNETILQRPEQVAAMVTSTISKLKGSTPT